MLFIDNDTVKRVLTMPDCIAVQEAAFKGLVTGASIYRPRLDMYVPCAREDGYYRWGSVDGASDGVLAVRFKSDIVTWPQSPDGSWIEQKYCIQPGTYCGLVILFSTDDGEPLAIINDGHLQHMRVGGGAGIGTRLLARADAQVVAMIGSGGMARTFLEAIAAVRDIRLVKVFSRTAQRRATFAVEMSEELGIEVKPVMSAREAVRGADIVCTCTDSMHPVIEADWLEPGMHMVNLGLREVPPAAVGRINVKVQQGSEDLPIPESERFRKGIGGSPGAFVAGTPEQQRRLPKPSAANAVGRDWPVYTDVISGKVPGRKSAQEISCYRAIGNWGVQFSSVGAHVYRRACSAGLGRELPTELFLQDIRN